MMETVGGSGFLGRVAERALGWVALGLVVAAGVAIWRMQPETREAIWSSIWRTAAWVGIAAVIPWLSRFVVGRVLEVGSNWAAVGLIAALLAADLIVAACLMTGWPTGGWGWFAGLAVLAAAGTYNFWVTEYLAERAGG